MDLQRKKYERLFMLKMTNILEQDQREVLKKKLFRWTKNLPLPCSDCPEREQGNVPGLV